MQADSGKEESFSATLLMNRSSDRWLLQQPLTSNSKPFPARRVTPTRLLSASPAADGTSPSGRKELKDEAVLARQVAKSLGSEHCAPMLQHQLELTSFLCRRWNTAYFKHCPKHLTLACAAVQSRCALSLPPRPRLDPPRPPAHQAPCTASPTPRSSIPRLCIHHRIIAPAASLDHPGKVKLLSCIPNPSDGRARAGVRGGSLGRHPANRTNLAWAAQSLLPR